VRQAIPAGQSGFVILNQTPFYGESGGQMGDAGLIGTRRRAVEVTDTQKKADGLFVHIGTVDEGTLTVGEAA
jgi:alanyl-tRNA synthetase